MRSNAEPPTLVIGLGNPILGDDGVGWRVVDTLQARLVASPPKAPVRLECLGVGGLGLMEHLVGAKRAILVDALAGCPACPGTLQVQDLADLPAPALGHINSAHDATLQQALALGRRLGVCLPERVTVVGIACEPGFDFSEGLSPAVETAVPQAVEEVLRLLEIIDPCG